MHEVCVCAFQCMLEFVLLEDLLDSVLEETQCLAVLFTNERDAGEVCELREVLWFLRTVLFERLGISLHQRFSTKQIILFQYFAKHSYFKLKLKIIIIYYILLNSFVSNDTYNNRSIIIYQSLFQNDELWNRARRRVCISSTRQWLCKQSRIQLQSNSRMVQFSKCGMGSTSGSICPAKSQFQQRANTILGLQSTNKPALSKCAVISEWTALWMEQQSSIHSSSESSGISFTFTWNALFRAGMWKLWFICSDDQKRLVISFQLCLFQYIKKLNHFLTFNESTQIVTDIRTNLIFYKLIFLLQIFPNKMGSCVGQANSNNYQGTNQIGYNIPNTNLGQNNNINPYQGWSNDHNQKQSLGVNQNQYGGQYPNQVFVQNQNQGWNQSQHQGSSAGWAHQNYSGNIWGHNNPFSWHNPFKLSIPRILFMLECRKCGGLGRILRRGRHIPCRRCYRHHGFCTKCYGTGINFMRNVLCRRCHGTGQKRHRHHKRRYSSSSSDSDW